MWAKLNFPSNQHGVITISRHVKFTAVERNTICDSKLRYRGGVGEHL